MLRGDLYDQWVDDRLRHAIASTLAARMLTLPAVSPAPVRDGGDTIGHTTTDDGDW